MLLPEDSLVTYLGDRTAKAFAKHLELKTVSDLLQHFPRRYSSRGELTPITDLPPDEAATVVADVVDVRERYMRGKAGNILEVRITDGEGYLSLTFFNQAWRAKELKPGVRGLFAGKITSYQGKLQLAHPDYELFPEEISDEDAKKWADLPIPIYPAASKVSTWMIQRAVGVLLDVLPPIVDELSEEIVRKNNLLSLDKAIRDIHQPAVTHDWQAARDTLRFHEAFLLQGTLLRRRLESKTIQATSRAAGKILEDFDKALPFTLTKGQVEVGNQILDDLAQEHPMHRMLQGEVGSGKTLVAVRAMLAVAESGGQSALLAPTEVLAAQHLRSIRKTLGEELSEKLGLTLLTGQMSTADHKRALLQIVSGKAQIVVGTHALISEKVEFFDLGLIVIDEQHRFGVEQREALRLKGKQPPHVLTMTATPIPRTLAVSVFGDLDISTLTELPAGRQGITSHVVQQSQSALVARTWSRIAEEVASGRQAFVVCSRIDDSEKTTAEENEVEEGAPALATVVGMVEALRNIPVLAQLKIEALHGRLSSEEKEDVMTRFANREIDVLVSTTVIEVGVDVPNATVMVVLDADRFGISQLHQLRGRVGRGGNAGLCLLLTAAEPGSVALERVTAVASTLDGFKLSEIDLELRREGDVLGSNQSGGRSSLKLLRVIRDADLIQDARGQVEKLFAADPTLEKHQLLAEALDAIEKSAQDNLAKN
ncbi:MAG: ATP-dependent DNA helicase RecG [Micrococcales bacterium]